MAEKVKEVFATLLDTTRLYQMSATVMGDQSWDRVVSASQYLGTRAYDAAASLSVDDAHNYLRWFILDAPIVPILILFHTFFAALSVYEVTPPRTFWLKSLVLTIATAFGGSTLAAMLVGRPAPLFTTSSNVMLLYVFAAWYAVNKLWAVRSLLSLRPCKAVLAFGANAARARAMFNCIDRVARDFPGAAVGAVLLGGLSGCGGRFFLSFENLVQTGGTAPFEFASPGWAFKSAFVASAAYYIATDPDDVLDTLGVRFWLVDRLTARLYITAAMCLHALLCTLAGRQFNSLFWLDALFYAFTGLRYGVKKEGVCAADSDVTVDMEGSQDSDTRRAGAAAQNAQDDRPADRLTGTGLRRRRRR